MKTQNRDELTNAVEDWGILKATGKANKQTSQELHVFQTAGNKDEPTHFENNMCLETYTNTIRTSTTQAGFWSQSRPSLVEMKADS